MASYDDYIKMKSGHKYGRMQQYPTMAPWQTELLKHYAKHPSVGMPSATKQPIFQSGMQYLQGIMSQNPEMMKQFEAPYMRQFNEQIMPNIAEQFAGAGALESSGFQNAAAGAGTDLMERLAALRSGLGMQASQQALAYGQVPFQEEYQRQGLGLQRGQLGLSQSPFGWQNIEPRGRGGGFWESAAPGIAEAGVKYAPEILAAITAMFA